MKRASKRFGRLSTADQGQSQGEETQSPDQPPLSASNHAWAALKPKSRPKKDTPITSIPVEGGQQSEKRKHARSVESQQPKHKKLKLAPLSCGKTRGSHIAHRAPKIDVNDSEGDEDLGYNDDGEEDAAQDSARDKTQETSSAEEDCGDVPANVLKAEVAQIVSQKAKTHLSSLASANSSQANRSKSASVAADSRPSTPLENPSRHPSTPSEDPSRHYCHIRTESIAPSTPSEHSHRLYQPAAFNRGPPMSDLENELDEFDTQSQSFGQPGVCSKNKTNRELKLEQERPVVHAPSKKKVMKWSSDIMIKKEEPDQAAEDLNVILWKPRTHLNIYMKSKKTAAIGLKEQNPDIRKVIHASYEFGRSALTIGDMEALLGMSNDVLLRMSTPFSTRRLEDIATHALIKGAESNGYDGEFDIMHHLEEGSQTLYIEPLQDYIAHCLALYRSHFKKAISLVIPGVLGLPTNSYQHNTNLLSNNAFIYPWNAETGFDTSKPFMNPVIAKSVECAFFTAGSQYNALGLEFASKLTLSSESGKCEVSIFMVVMACVAITSIIQDMLLSRSTDFAGPQLDSLFKKLVIVLISLRRSRPITYHKTMHGIHMAAVGEKSMSLISNDLTAEEIIGEISWDLIDE
ncbi:hypothetical protein JVT61DRAFT_7878 [Boletus reticuloceps]|uniref:DUF6532 domain-containing protein n=1 Tax=Boletus reticuloceps TaxID=495285 RepID=A0A8I2YID3_9AGAM|nr:hypothetical protein JVT61DRAFT_7878 [Boletus reticuloceps]